MRYAHASAPHASARAKPNALKRKAAPTPPSKNGSRFSATSSRHSEDENDGLSGHHRHAEPVRPSAILGRLRQMVVGRITHTQSTRVRHRHTHLSSRGAGT